MATKKKFEFYEIRNLFKSYPQAKYYVIYGERSNGKTYSAKDYALERYVATGEQFAYIRRFAEDIKPKNLGNLFSDMAVNGRIVELTKGIFNNISYGSGKFTLETRTEGGDIIKGEEPVGFAFDLNSMEHYKSLSYPKITTIIFDEFMSRNGYLPNEWILFMNALSTIIRHRDNVRVIMLGNTVNKYCPYFVEMGIKHIGDQKPGTVDVYQYGDSDLQVVCEYTGTSKKSGGKASDVYFAFDNPELKMITGGEWEISIYPHLSVKLRPKDTIMNFFIDFNECLLHGEVVSRDDGYFVFLHPKTTKIKDEDRDIIYTTTADERWNHRMCLTKHHDKLSLFIMQCLRENKIFYSSNEVGEVFRNYVMWSDSYSIKN